MNTYSVADFHMYDLRNRHVTDSNFSESIQNGFQKIWIDSTHESKDFEWIDSIQFMIQVTF